ncbi:MAG: class I SAM-dependent methyltransferase [Proteobacteria bacterium]|nr:class I SAM-dependent methyltransferase [Pseudomonadota bacterium]
MLFSTTLTQLLTLIDSQVDYNFALKCGQQIKKNANTCVDCHRRQFFNGGRISYSCDQIKSLYVLRYLPVHIRENFTILQGLLQIFKTNKIEVNIEEPIEVLSLGCGPGPEIAAFKMFINQNGYFGSDISDYQITKIDSERGWGMLQSEVENLFISKNFRIKYTSETGDVSTCENLNKKYDIVFLSYILSELSDCQVNGIAKNLHNILKNKAILIFNDRNQAMVVARIKQILSTLNCLYVFQKTGKTDIGIYYPQFIGIQSQPKIFLNSFRLGAFVKL